MTVQITIIGLGKIGASLGLALKSQTHQLTRVGHDRSISTMRTAEKMGMVDRTENNLHAAVEKADIVYLALPLDEIRPTLEEIAPDLMDGSAVIDASILPHTVCAWAQELLPAGRHFISALPTLNSNYLDDTTTGIDGAHEDLFKNGLFVISSPPNTDSEALKLAADLGLLVGAHTLFSDPLEVQGLTSASYLAPRLVAAAFMNALTAQPGWLEGRKVAGQLLSQITLPADSFDEQKQTGAAVLYSKENTVRVLNDIMLAIRDLRDIIEDGSEDELRKQLEQAQTGRDTWLAQRRTRDWDTILEAPKMPTSGDIFSRFFGFRRRKKE